METETKHINWTRLGITTGLVILTALVVGGSTWYVMDKNAKADKETNEQTVKNIQQQLDGLNDQNSKDFYTSTRFKVSFNKNNVFINEDNDGIAIGYSEIFTIPQNSMAPGNYGPIMIRSYDKGISASLLEPKVETKTFGNENATITSSSLAQNPYNQNSKENIRQIVVDIPSKNITILVQERNVGGNYDWSKVNTIFEQLSSSLKFI